LIGETKIVSQKLKVALIIIIIFIIFIIIKRLTLR